LDSDWNKLNYCDFTKLEIPGAKHSGDMRSAPYPSGARETISLDLPLLKKEYPTCRFVAIMAYVYSGSLDRLHDASAFVGNPLKAGTGPGGIELISAARLSGKGRTNICGFLSLEEERQYFYCVDHTLNVQVKTASGSNTHIKTIGQQIMKGVGKTIKLQTLTSLYSSLISDEVHILHDGGETTLYYNDIDSAQRNFYTFFNKINETFNNLKTALKPKPKISEKEGQKLVIFGGDLMDHRMIAADNPFYTKTGTLTVVNVCSDIKRVENIKINNIGTVRLVRGTETLDIL